MNSYISVYLNEPQSLSFQDIEVRFDACPLLSKELMAFNTTPKAYSIDTKVYIDEWSASLFIRVPLDKVEIYRALVGFLFASFLESRFFQQLCSRFKVNTSKMLVECNETTMLSWLILWAERHFPMTTALVFDKTQVGQGKLFFEIPLAQLVQYLPPFMLWRLNDLYKKKSSRHLLLCLANGQNVRSINGFPVQFTKKMAHFFSTAPRDYDLDKAIWYGIVMGYNGDDRLLDAFYQSFKGWYTDGDFLKKVISFFVNQKPVKEHHRLCRLLGYLRHLRDEQPNFSLKGWTLDSCQKRADAYYIFIETPVAPYANYPLTKTWKGADYEAFFHQEEDWEYYIEELTKYGELLEEGKQMSHCVGSYVSRCSQGLSSIWALRKSKDHKMIRLATIEVDHHRTIVQARSKYNAKPDQLSMRLIKQWATQANLFFSRY